MWRTNKALPERGRIGVFNRSYYEEVLVVKVHNLVKTSSIPEEYITKDIWDRRYSHIKNMEKYLIENGIIPVKIFLNVSKEEQKNRFLERIENPEKNWKFASGDVTERKYWDDYQNAYEEASIGGLRANAAAFIVNLSFFTGIGLLFALGALILEKDNKFVRFYGKQTLALNVIVFLSFLLNLVIVIGSVVWVVLIFAITILQVYATVKSFFGETFEIPFINKIMDFFFFD